MCNHEMIDCPEHEGGYDCTPFCKVCEGEQGYCPVCADCKHTFLYESPTYDQLRCLDCDAEIENEDEDDELETEGEN